MSVANEIIRRAREQATDMNYSFEEALGDIMGTLLWEVDAALYTEGDRLPKEEDSLFHLYFTRHVNNWFNKGA